MKILVTGGAGFIGSNLISKLLNLDMEVESIDNYSIGSIKNHVKGAIYHKIDVNEVNHLKNDFELIFHLAGLSRIQPSFKNPTKTFLSNTSGTESLLEWSRSFNSKIVYSGSSSRHHNPYQSPYALYKYLGEEICKMYRKSFKINIEIVRFYNVYGPNEILSGKWAAVIGIWRNQIQNNKPLTIIGDGKQRRDFTHVDDIVEGLIKIGFCKKKYNYSWELGSGKNYSLNEVYELFNKKFNSKKIHLPDQSGNYKETIRKDNKAIDLLGWNPNKKLEEYIKNL
ncbi:MAG: hypothetical protein CBD39_02840 [Flavobacteriaceae bacterium TMED179]|nr:MAG: hypothetical protein CBD39_02840 [Flavobacteriaceae bacterium TMED179]|tara:strand:+ start:13126 stop:13971 length:846 start_codon:yes stop_codon:yes gene_type:complete